MVERWYKKARLFILEQRRNELERAVARYPDSDRYAQRRVELAEIENEINVLNAED